MKVHVVKAGRDDIETIRQLTFAIWPVAYKEILSPAQLEYMLGLFYSHGSLLKQMEDTEFILLKEDDNPIGFAAFGRKADSPGKVFHLHKIYILPGMQGKDYGRFLMRYIMEEIKKQGAEKLTLNVNRHNTAKLFYEKLGFSIASQEDIPIGHDYFMNDYIMEKSL